MQVCNNIMLLKVAILGLFLGLAASKKFRSKDLSLSEDNLDLHLEGDYSQEKKPEEKSNNRSGKLFSLFNIVQFKNNACRSQSPSTSPSGASTRNGTCYTSSECVSKGGSVSGNCAAGFGVCCLFLVSATSSTIIQNNTYIRNPGFPTSYGAMTTVTYMVQKCTHSVCWLRLDFDTFTILGTTLTTEFDGGLCVDTFVVTTPTAQAIPTICGQNTGQHMYIDLGNSASDSATLTFTFGALPSTTRSWEIKVTQIECAGSTNIKPPPGCLQYNTGLTGRITTFNFIPTNDNHLAMQDYSICVRQESGFCCVQYLPCADANSFSLDASLTGLLTVSSIDSNCFLVAMRDYIAIPASQGTCIQGNSMVPVVNKYCGGFLNAEQKVMSSAAVCDCTAPFSVQIVTNTVTDVAANAVNTRASRGICLTYMQIPCAS